MATQTTMTFYTAREAGDLLGVSDAYVRQLCIDHEEIGTKHGHVWMLTDVDLDRIRSMPSFGTGPRFRKKPE